jgi:hypothetical protein
LTWTVALSAAPARADFTKLLPAETELVLTINVRQILDSPPVKKNVLEQARAIVDGILQFNEDAKRYIDTLGLDLFKDINRITIADGSDNQQERKLVIIEGQFNPTKFKDAAADAAKNHGDVLKIGKLDDLELWEISIPGENTTLYSVLLDRTTLLVASSRDGVAQAVAQAGGKKAAGALKKEMQLISKASAKQSMALVASTGGLMKSLENSGIKLDAILPFFKGALNDMPAFSLGFTVEDDLKLQVAFCTKDPKSAKAFERTANQALLGAQFLAMMAARNDERLALLVDIVRTLRVTVDGQVVIIHGRITQAALEKAFNPGQGQEK